MSTTRTFGAPVGALAWPISPQSGSEPSSVWAAVPAKGARRIGSTVRSISSVISSSASFVEVSQRPEEDMAAAFPCRASKPEEHVSVSARRHERDGRALSRARVAGRRGSRLDPVTAGRRAGSPALALTRVNPGSEHRVPVVLDADHRPAAAGGLVQGPLRARDVVELTLGIVVQ